MQLFLAKPSDAAPIAAFLTGCTGKKWDEMLIQNDVADKTQYCVKQNDAIIAVFNIKSLGVKGQELLLAICAFHTLNK